MALAISTFLYRREPYSQDVRAWLYSRVHYRGMRGLPIDSYPHRPHRTHVRSRWRKYNYPSRCITCRHRPILWQVNRQWFPARHDPGKGLKGLIRAPEPPGSSAVLSPLNIARLAIYYRPCSTSSSKRGDGELG